MYHQRVQPARVTDDAGRNRTRIEGIEALRGLAAVAVVLCHASRHVDQAFGAPMLVRLFRPGHAGVDLFFVLSGFIILLVHRRDIDRPDRIGRYAWRRFVRVWPLYWLALFATLAKRWIGGADWPAGDVLARNMTLLPTSGEPLLGIAWTLQYEALFYLLFGLLLADRRIGAAGLGGWLALLAVAAMTGLRIDVVTGMFAIEFFFGMAAAELVRRGLPQPRMVAAMGALLFAAAWMAEATGLLDGYGLAARLAYGLPATMIVAGIATVRPHVPRSLAAIGTASYAVYLFHLLGIGAAWQLMERLRILPPPALSFAVLAGSGIAGGLVMHRLVERPMLARLRR